MATIELHNTYSRLIDATNVEMTAVDNAISVDTPNCEFSTAYRSGMWDGRTRFFNKRGNKFPTGLLYEAYKAVKRTGVAPEIVDKRDEVGFELPDSIQLLDAELGHITLRDYQYDAVSSALHKTRGVINVATNGGKTEIAAGIIQCILPKLKKGQRIVFFTHAKEIFTQSHKRLSARLGVPVGRIGDGVWEEEQVCIVMIPTIQKYVSKPKDLTSTKKLKDMINNLQILQSVMRTSGVSAEDKLAYKQKAEIARAELKAYEEEQWEKINANVERTQKFLASVIGFIGDEVHHAKADTWYQVLMGMDNAYYRIGLTGTVDESQPIGVMRLNGCTGRIISKVSNDFLIENGYSARPTIYMLPIPTKAIVAPYQEARRMGIIENDVRNRVFVNKILERAKLGKQCLVIVNEIEHGDIVLDMLRSENVLDPEEIKLSHGDKNDKYRIQVLDDLKSGKLKILIATSILDEGVDVSGINCLFLMAGGKSMRQALQRVGRGLRKKADGSGLEVYDALDYHNEYLADHTAERYHTYKDEKFEIIKL